MNRVQAGSRQFHTRSDMDVYCSHHSRNVHSMMVNYGRKIKIPSNLWTCWDSFSLVHAIHVWYPDCPTIDHVYLLLIVIWEESVTEIEKYSHTPGHDDNWEILCKVCRLVLNSWDYNGTIHKDRKMCNVCLNHPLSVNSPDRPSLCGEQALSILVCCRK